jgi:putative endonuclease
MMNLRKLLGLFGEDHAVKYLKKNGYRIIERNYSNKLGEIDIVAKEKGTIVFVEVKTRNSTLFGSPKEAVHLQKQKKISKVALAWLKQHNKMGEKARFDVVAILQANSDKNKNELQIELVKNAFDLR